MNSKERFQKVLEGSVPDRTPVFPLLMSFSAKRYGVSYREFASNGRVLAEAQLSAREKYPIDAITACSDAFRIAADLGGAIVFPETKPPSLSEPLVKNKEDFLRLKKPDVLNPKGRMRDRVNALAEMVRAVGDECMVLGWVDMPFAEACSLCGVTEFLMMLYDEPGLAHGILGFLADIVAEFAAAQLEAGAPMIGAGDAAASLISAEAYREFALPYEKRVCEAVHKAGGLLKLHICGNTSHIMADMTALDADLYNVDHLVNFDLAMKNYTAHGKAFKGNLDPVEDILFSTPEECRKKAAACVEKAKGMKYILSPGCEVPEGTPDEVFLAFCDAVNG